MAFYGTKDKENDRDMLSSNSAAKPKNEGAKK
jgi:hypothetical protein